MLDNIARKMEGVVRIARSLSYICEDLSLKKFYDGETATGDKVTIGDVLRNEFLMFHKVIEISESKEDSSRLRCRCCIRCTYNGDEI
ncbi:MAG: hypothetical protein QXQ29_02870 [Candidatus Bathyarchaeia archaeon]